MTDESTTQRDPSRSSESRSGAGASTTPATKPGLGDPARHDFGDKTERTNPKTDPTADKDQQDAGEGHKGPRVDATRANPDVPKARSDQFGR
jgi:hypothetical protein